MWDHATVPTPTLQYSVWVSSFQKASAFRLCLTWAWVKAYEGCEGTTLASYPNGGVVQRFRHCSFMSDLSNQETFLLNIHKVEI